MCSERLATRQFSDADQQAFARLSGDSNPLHVDEVAARRLLFGEQVVHGVHGLLWGLDVYLAKSAGAAVGRLVKLRAKFGKAIRLARDIECHVVDADPAAFSLRLIDAGVVIAEISGAFDEAEVQPSRVSVSETPAGGQCVEVAASDMKSCRGTVRLGRNSSDFAERFPQLNRGMAPAQIAELLATTYVVGMRCPGLHSVFLGLTLTRCDGVELGPLLHYRVKRAIASMVTVHVEGPTLEGTLDTLVRPGANQQATMGDVAAAMAGSEFSGQRAVVVGGSRGIGEVTAKLLAAGGASVCITYYRGRADAERVRDEICVAGGACHIAQFDCVSPVSTLPERCGFVDAPTHMYFFATPRITMTDANAFSWDVYAELAKYYVGGLWHALQAVRGRGQAPLRVLYPSTVYLDEMPKGTAEYCAAKAAAEQLCRQLSLQPGLAVQCPRLPRMRTDQTVGIMPTRDPEPLSVMVQVVRDFAAQSQ